MKNKYFIASIVIIAFMSVYSIALAQILKACYDQTLLKFTIAAFSVASTGSIIGWQLGRLTRKFLDKN